MPFIALEARAVKPLFPGIDAKTFWGENILLSYVTLVPHAVATMHAHPEEQAGIVISGSLDFTIGDETRTMHPGDMYIAPGNVQHEARAGADGCVILDIFSPLRALLQY